DLVVLEWMGRGNGEEISDAGVVIDGERAAGVCDGDLVGPPPAYPRRAPGLAGEEGSETSIGVDPEHGHVARLVGPEIDPGTLTPPVGGLAVGPHTDPSRGIRVPARRLLHGDGSGGGVSQ